MYTLYLLAIPNPIIFCNESILSCLSLSLSLSLSLLIFFFAFSSSTARLSFEDAHLPQIRRTERVVEGSHSRLRSERERREERRGGSSSYRCACWLRWISFRSYFSWACKSLGVNRLKLNLLSHIPLSWTTHAVILAKAQKFFLCGGAENSWKKKRTTEHIHT